MQLPFENLRILKKYLTLKDFNFDITIYSEQPDYYYLFKDILDHFPKKILYIYSSTKDKIINHKNENLFSFYVSNGYLRDFIFNNLKSNVVIMSTPDLNSFSLKRSNFVNNYFMFNTVQAACIQYIEVEHSQILIIYAVLMIIITKSARLWKYFIILILRG